jgi:glucose/arabinose dehydrogenase
MARLVLGCLLFISAVAAAQTPVIILTTAFTGLSSPVYLTHADDGSGRRFLVEQAGRILVAQPGSKTTSVFMDISDRVLNGGERGLLGLAFHPAYSTNGRFFVNYTRPPDGATVIAEFLVSANPNAGSSNSEVVILTIDQPYENHNGGMIEFGPDGYLYIAMGDGGSANDPENRAQNIDELLGKVLRIDIDNPQSQSVHYSSPATNPFFGATPGRDEIYALGLRNPWRFSFDRLDGTLFLGDVGQTLYEEIDIVTLGGNYGWRVFEGAHCTGLDPCAGTYIPPVAEYTHEDGRCSVIGGYVYRGSAGSLPAGAYIFGDLCTGEIRMLKDGVQTYLTSTPASLVSFGEDQAGEIYAVTFPSAVYQIKRKFSSQLTSN